MLARDLELVALLLDLAEQLLADAREELAAERDAGLEGDAGT
jgi:hypothetical protein